MRSFVVAAVWLGLAFPASAADEATPDLAVVREGRAVMDLRWTPSSCAASPDAAEGARDRVLPRSPSGRLLGRLVLHDAWLDRRGQSIGPGRYALYLGVQPLSKNHAGTTERRDHLVLVADREVNEGCLDEVALWSLSRRVSGTSHPAVMEIRPAGEGGRPSDDSTVLATIDGEEVLLVLEAPPVSGLF